MELIAKLIGAVLIDENGKVKMSVINKVKDFIVIAFIIENLLIAGIFYIADDEDACGEEYVECVDE